MFLLFKILLSFADVDLDLCCRASIFGEGNAKVFKSVQFFQLFSVHEDIGHDVGCAVDQDFTLPIDHFHSICSCSLCESVGETLQFGIADDSPYYVHSELSGFLA